MAIFWYLAIALLTGWPVVYRLAKRGAGEAEFHPAALAGLAYLSGTGLIGAEMLLLLMVAGILPGAWLCWFFSIQIICLFVVCRERLWFKRRSAKSEAFSYLQIILAGLAISAIVVSMAMAWLKPAMAWDSLAHWNSKSSSAIDNPDAFFVQGGWLNSAKPYYPWQTPLLMYLVDFLHGSNDDALTNYVFVAYYAAILAIIYGILQSSDRIRALILTIVAGTVPMIFYHSFNSYADLAVGAYGLAGLVFWLMWKKRGSGAYLFASLLFWSNAGLVKTEGYLFVVAWLILTGLAWYRGKRPWRKLLPYLTGALPLLAWLTYSKLNKLGSYLGGLQRPDKFLLHWDIFIPLARQFFIFSSWGIFWYMVIGYLAVNFTALWRSRVALWGWCWVGLIIVAFLCAYLLTPAYAFVLDNTAASRNALLIVPSIILLMGWPLEASEKNGR